MSLRKLPTIKAEAPPSGLPWEVRPDALDRWNPAIRAAEADDSATISIYDTIGFDPWTGEGVTAKRIAAALRSIGKREVSVNINSPGGDFFEGIAIYNLLREHPAKVSVRVMGIAASAASVIAMAGDDVEIGQGAFLMIHNAWAVAIGNRHDMAKAAEFLAPFDESMADLYAAHTGLKVKDVAAMMDAETFIGAEQAVEEGWADRVMPVGREIESNDPTAKTRRTLAVAEAAFARAGLNRKDRRAMLRDLTSPGTPRAAEPATPRAGAETFDVFHTVNF